MSLLAKLKSLLSRPEPASLGETEKANLSAGVKGDRVGTDAGSLGPPPPAPPAGN